MSKPVTVEIKDEVAEALAQVANDLGETQEQFVVRAVEARVAAFRDNAFFSRRQKGFDREAEIEWLLRRSDGEPPRAGDELPPDYIAPR